MLERQAEQWRAAGAGTLNAAVSDTASAQQFDTVFRTPVITQILERQQAQIADVLGGLGRSQLGELANAIALRDFALTHTTARISSFIESTRFRRLSESFNALSSMSLGIDRFTQPYFDYLRNLTAPEVLAAHEIVDRGWWLVPSWDVRFVLDLLDERKRRRTPLGVVLAEHYRKQNCRELGRLVADWDLEEFRMRGRLLCSNPLCATTDGATSAP